MALFIRIEDDHLEHGFRALMGLQRPPASAAALAGAILAEAVEACVGDPERWKRISTLAAAPPGSNGSGAPSVHGRTDTTPAPEPVSSSIDQQAGRRPTAAGPQAPAPDRGPGAVPPA